MVEDLYNFFAPLKIETFLHLQYTSNNTFQELNSVFLSHWEVVQTVLFHLYCASHKKTLLRKTKQLVQEINWTSYVLKFKMQYSNVTLFFKLRLSLMQQEDIVG